MANTCIKKGLRVAQSHIDSLADGEVFVFGSNVHGMHGGGAAWYAAKHFGAEWGVGEGLTADATPCQRWRACRRWSMLWGGLPSAHGNTPS